jgi:hypothetical protein
MIELFDVGCGELAVGHWCKPNAAIIGIGG